MELLKKHLIVVISAAVAVIALVVLFLGRAKVSRAQGLLEEAAAAAETIEQLRKGVQVETEPGKIERVILTEPVLEKFKEADLKKKDQSFDALRETLAINIGRDPETGKIKRMPLIEGVFPEPVNDAKRYVFRARYKEAIQELLDTLQAGVPPTVEDAQAEREKLERLLGLTALEYTPEELTAWAWEEAATKRAKSIKIYADRDSLDVIEEVYHSPTGGPPSTEEMWWAQLSLWLQQDIIAAIAQMNKDAGHVGESPVKRLVKIRIQHGYQFLDSLGETSFYGLPSGKEFEESFSGISPNKFYDITRFRLEVIIDVTQIPQLVDAMYRQGHYLLYQWEIESDQGQPIEQRGGRRELEDYRYGSSPVVTLISNWEAFLIRDFYMWGIVNYDIDQETSKLVVTLYDGKKVTLPDKESREGLKGLMPTDIRKVLLGEEEEEEGTGLPRRAGRRAPRRTR